MLAFRGRLAVLVLGAAAAFAASTLTAGSARAAADDPPATPMRLTLYNSQAYSSRISTIDRDLYSPGLSSIIAPDANQASDLNRVMTGCTSGALSGAANVWHHFCFDGDDDGTALWTPQGVSGVYDSAEDYTWGDQRPGTPMLLSWYSNEGKGIRVSIIDTYSMRYRHALLVEPTGDSKGYRGVNVHAGGIAWYGRYLYVADTEQGIRVFDMYHLFDLGAGAQTNSTAYTNVTDNTRVGIDNNGTPRNTYYGYGYRFLIPQIATWRQAGTVNPHKQLDSNNKEMSYLCAKGSVPNEDSYGMRFSWLTVDRSPTKTFAAGEFCRDYGSAYPGNRGRMAQWNADAIHSRTVDRKDGESVSPIYAWRLPAYSVQGAAHAGPYWYFNSSIGCNPAIQTVRRRLGTDWSGTVQRASAIGAEDLYLERPPNGVQVLWSVAEYAEVHRTCSGANNNWRVLYSQTLVP